MRGDMNVFQKTIKYVALFIAVMALNAYNDTKMTFNVDKADSVVHKEIFGVLMERLGKQWDGNGAIWVGTSSSTKNTDGMRQDVIDGFKECGVGAAEWPGGCAANHYNWSANKTPTNAVGVKRFIEFCNLTGAEAVIAAPCSTSSMGASNLAFGQYIMDSLNYPLKWFKLGNEMWGGCGTNYTSTYLSYYSSSYDKVKALKSLSNGQNLSIIAAAGAMEGSYDWITTYLTSSAASTMDGFEFHDYVYYPDNISSTSPTTANYWTIMKDVNATDVALHIKYYIIPLMKASDPNKRVKAVLDEWGDWLEDIGDGWMQTATLMDAISASSHLHMFIQNADRFGVCCLAQGVNVIHSLMNVNTSGVSVKTPTFYVFKLMIPHHTNNAKFMPMSDSSYETVNGNGYTLEAVNVAGTVDSNHIVNISFSNIDLTATHTVKVTLTSSSVSSYSVKSAEIVTGTAYTSTNDFGAAEQVNIQTLASSNYSVSGKVLTVTLPAKSIVMIRLSSPTAISRAQLANLVNNMANAFSVKPGVHGTVIVTSSVSQNTPVTISLYGIDGRNLIARTSRTFERGSACVLGNNTISNGVYFVKIAGPSINLSKQVVVTR